MCQIILRDPDISNYLWHLHQHNILIPSFWLQRVPRAVSVTWSVVRHRQSMSATNFEAFGWMEIVLNNSPCYGAFRQVDAFNYLII